MIKLTNKDNLGWRHIPSRAGGGGHPASKSRIRNMLDYLQRFSGRKVRILPSAWKHHDEYLTRRHLHWLLFLNTKNSEFLARGHKCASSMTYIRFIADCKYRLLEDNKCLHRRSINQSSNPPPPIIIIPVVSRSPQIFESGAREKKYQ